MNKRNGIHSLEAVAASVAIFAIVVCGLAAHGDSLSGGPANASSSQASSEQSSQASTQSSSETDLKPNPNLVATKSAVAHKHHSAGNARELQRLINSPDVMGTKVSHHRKAVLRSRGKHKIAIKNRKSRKNWKTVNYDWHSKTKSTSYVDMTKTH